MKILFCNITYLRSYLGTIEEDLPIKGGAWVAENQDAHEKWNFLNYNGFCYGFVQNSGQFHIERLEGVSRQEASTDGVTVVWCALNPDGETVIVGWYENATVYRYYQDSMMTPLTGLDRIYFTKALAEDCYLLPEDERTYTIGRASQLGKGHGFGQQNYWWADSEYAKENIIPDVLKYLNKQKGKRINRLSADFMPPVNLDQSLTESEQKEADDFYEEGEYFRFLPLGYRSFAQTHTADDAYFTAAALRELYQFDEALVWLHKVVELEGHSWATDSELMCLRMQCGYYRESLELANVVLEYPEGKEAETRCEIYSIIADNYYYLGDYREGIQWLDKVIATSSDTELIEFTKANKEAWEAML